MITLRKADERGYFDHGWLKTHHTFSFGHYYDPRHTGFRALRVLNDDTVEAGAGFPTHPHRDMEILSFVVDGSLEHRDSMGTGSVVRAGDVQRMSAGKGVTHSEFNHSGTEALRFLQIWLQPERRGLEPGYEQKHFDRDDRHGELRLVASRAGRDGSVTVHQDVDVYASVLDPGDVVEHPLRNGRAAWVQVIDGRLRVGDLVLGRGDGAAIADQSAIRIEGGDPTGEFLLFDLA